MDPHNDKTFCDRKVSDYWNQVDIYIGGTEHAVGHLLYSRMWTKFLFDLGLIGFDEPYKKLVNQGMIQGVSEKICVSAISFENLKSRHKLDRLFVPIGEGYDVDVYDPEEYSGLLRPTDVVHQRKQNLEDYFLDKGYANTIEYRVDVTDVENHILGINSFLNSNRGKQYKNAIFLCEGGFWFQGNFHRKNNGSDKFFTEPEVEKMSKSKYNVINPNELCEKYGADTFRMYEMFLGPVEASKPWDTKGIEGVHRFLKKLWRLFFKDPSPSERGGGEVIWNEEAATDTELKILHRTIKRIEEDTERFSFNTAVSTFMICVNELADIKCHKKEILEPLLILLAPYAPHICEELYQQLNSSQVLPPIGGEDLGGARASVLDATYPKLDASLLVESSKEYPVSINGKLRTTLLLALDLEQKQVEEIILQNEIVKKWLEGKPPKKIIYVRNKMINVVV
jgi:leucyl-tRNA synthetase